MKWDGYLPRRRIAVFHDCFFKESAVLVTGDDIERAEKWGGFIKWFGPERPEQTLNIKHKYRSK